jgi:hypothetical protein
MIALAFAVALAVQEPATDAEFLRRVTLDLSGTIPTADQARAFLADADCAKREKLIDRLLASPNYVRRMEQAITVMFLERRSGGKIPDAQWSDFLRKAFASNESWDKIVRSMISADGLDEDRPAMKLLADGANGEPHRMTNDIARLFLGRNLLCAQCHDHPSVKEYKQSEYMGLYAYLSLSKLQDDPKTRKAMLIETAPKGKSEYASVFSPGEKYQTGPKLPGGEEVDIPKAPGFRPREMLAEALVRHPQFARNSVNRFWFLFMGRGLVHPLDYDHQANPPSDPALLDSLTAEFVASGFDVRKLVRRIITSPSYARTPLKPLSAEQMAWATMTATGNLDRIPKVHEGSKFSAGAYLSGRKPEPPTSLPDILKLFVSVFGNAEGEAEVGFQPSMTHALFLMNDRLVLDWLQPAEGNLVSRLSKLTGDAVAEELYLSVLTRMPTAVERKEVSSYLERKGPKGLGDLAWALVASTEFRMNH